MHGDELLEDRDDVGVTTELQLGVDEVFPGSELERLEARDLPCREQLEGEVGEWRPTDEQERAAEQVRTRLRIGTAGFRDEPLEADHVDGVRRQTERVAAATRRDHV